MIARITLGALSLILAGCASQIMNSYVGKPLTQPILEYGEPAAAYDMGDGRRAFVWVMQQQGVIPAYTMTTGNAHVVTTGTITPAGNALAYSAMTNANLYSNTTIMPPVAYSFQCHYALLARRARADVDGPAAWQVVGYQPPKLACE